MSDYLLNYSKNLIRIPGAVRGNLGFHRLQQYTTYPRRKKYYDSEESFAEVMEKLAKKTKLIYPL